ncbi:MAG TPA: nuclear transport factor 2 family protein [Solirubrobacterales bacterium]|nr:nuclear transport factor 2 family protein [Solirubrobacterales bacterium]
MTAASQTTFDTALFKRAYEEWDIPALLGLYGDEVELTQISGDNPPSSPRTQHGKEVFRGMFEHCKSAGVKATVEHTVADEEHAAATVTCEFPGGRKVVANAILELQDGRIVREHDVVSGD